MSRKKSSIQGNRKAKRQPKTSAARRSRIAQPSKQRTRSSSRTESIDIQRSHTGRLQASNQPEPALQKSEQRFRQKGNKLTQLESRISERTAGLTAANQAMQQELTARKRALEHSRELLQSFMKHTPAAVAMFDKQLRYLAVSKRWLQDYQLADQHLIGRHHYDVFPEIRKMKEWQDIHQRCLAGAVESREEDSFVRHGTTMGERSAGLSCLRRLSLSASGQK